MFAFLLSNEPVQRLRLQRLAAAMAGYALWVGLAFAMHLAGMLRIPETMVAPTLAGIAATNLYFYVLIRSGLNKNLDDPSMTVSQIVVALTWVLVLMFIGVEVRGLLLTVYVICLLYGVFQLRSREFAALALFALLGYAAIVALDLWLIPERVNVRLEGMRMLVLASSMAWAGLFGNYVSALRKKLRQRNAELQEALEEVHHVALHDHLTQTYNRRYVMQMLNQEKSRADRTRRAFSVCILDLDHFKIINDRYGHLAGDRVLMAFSERCKGTLRGMDFVGVDGTRTFGRYGGEEFIIVFPETALRGAYQCAERIREVTAGDQFDDVFSVTVSGGVAEYRLGESIEDTLRRADAALYRAKDKGRNQVMADDTPTPALYSLGVDGALGPKIIVGEFGGRAGAAAGN